jgi:hypothetical protein
MSSIIPHHTTGQVKFITEMSDFEICTLLGNNTAYSGNSFLTFQDNLLVPSSSVKKCVMEEASSIAYFSIYVLVFST